MLKYGDLSDNELASLLREDDRSAFTEIYNRYKGLLYIHAFNKLRNKEEARDVVQQLFSILWNKRREIDFKTNLTGYLYTAIRNRVLKVISRKQVADAYIDSIKQSINQGEVITDHRVRENQLKQIIEKEIALLPPKMREIFELSRKSHLSHREIAEKLDISEQTVAKQVSNALKILRTKLGLITFLIFLIKY